MDPVNIPNRLTHAVVNTSSAQLPRAVGHNLRTCLGQILGYSELLIEDPGELGQLEIDLKKIHEAGKQILEMVNIYVDPLRVAADGVYSLPMQSSTSDKMDVSLSVTVEGCRILVVGGSATSREKLQVQMKSFGCTTRLVDDERMLDLLHDDAFDLILLEMTDQPTGEFEMLKHLKGNPHLQDISIVVVASLDQQEVVLPCLDLGANDFIFVPIHTDLMKVRCGANLEKKRLRNQETQHWKDLRANYDRIQELERQRESLTQMIVRDVRNPLASLLTGLQALLVMGDLSEEHSTVVNRSINEGYGLLAIMNDLLDVTSMEKRSEKLYCSQINPETLIGLAQQQVRSQAEINGQQLQREYQGDLLTFTGDESKLRRTLVNLLIYALEDAPDEATISIGARWEHDLDEIRFFVRNIGKEISSEAQRHMFEKFQQIDSRHAGSRDSAGPSLGLTFSRMAVELHGGRIWVESEPGQGSAFWFAVPIHQKITGVETPY